MSVLVALHKEVFDGFDIFGVVKEIGVDDEGLIEFWDKYFKFPLYVDKSYAFYQALGDRRVSLKAVLNPFSIFGLICDAIQRIRSKSIGGSLKGEGIVQGGIIVFGADRKPRCMYQEETGVDLKAADLVVALDVIRNKEESSG